MSWLSIFIFVHTFFRKNKNNTCYFSEQNFMGSKSFLSSTRNLSNGKWFYLNESWGSFLFHAMRKDNNGAITIFNVTVQNQ